MTGQPLQRLFSPVNCTSLERFYRAACPLHDGQQADDCRMLCSHIVAAAPTTCNKLYKPLCFGFLRCAPWPDIVSCHAIQEAIISGFFRQGKPGALPVIEEVPDKQLAEEPKPDGGVEAAVRMDAILSTALEVSHGMSYLHARSIVHGDLTGSNVLLQENLVRARACLDVLSQVGKGVSA